MSFSLKLRALELKDMVNFKTAQFMYIINNKLPVHIEGLFHKQECSYNIRKDEM